MQVESGEIGKENLTLSGHQIGKMMERSLLSKFEKIGLDYIFNEVKGLERFWNAMAAALLIPSKDFRHSK